MTFRGALHVGNQDLMIAKPSNSWAGTNAIIEVSEIRSGLAIVWLVPAGIFGTEDSGSPIRYL